MRKKKRKKRERQREENKKKMVSPVTVSGANNSLLRFRMIKSPLGLTFPP
jgi:hypothetical protein